jgi:hypothetical protein
MRLAALLLLLRAASAASADLTIATADHCGVTRYGEWEAMADFRREIDR